MGTKYWKSREICQSKNVGTKRNLTMLSQSWLLNFSDLASSVGIWKNSNIWYLKSWVKKALKHRTDMLFICNVWLRCLNGWQHYNMWPGGRTWFFFCPTVCSNPGKKETLKVFWTTCATLPKLYVMVKDCPNKSVYAYFGFLCKNFPSIGE